MSGNVKLKEINNKKLLKFELDNPAKNNAIDMKMLDKMISIISDRPYINNFIGIIITGAKNGPFSSGADLSDIKALRKNNNLQLYHEKVDTLTKLLTAIKLPVITLIKKYCFGAGFIIALHADILFASEKTIFCIPASKLKIKIPKRQLLSLKKRVNHSFLKEIIWSARKFNAVEAYKNNIINAYITENNFDNFTDEYLKELSSIDKEMVRYYSNILKRNKIALL